MKDKIVMTTFGQTLKDSLIDGEDNNYQKSIRPQTSSNNPYCL